jgi:uncharacterized membrane protein YeaQ/YmgE (transglycosylase-associated protein family)
MSLMEFLILLLVAALCGAFAQAITGYSTGGCLVSIALGFIGALIGIWLARLAGLPKILVIDVGGTSIPIVWTILGGALFCGLLQFLRRRP